MGTGAAGFSVLLVVAAVGVAATAAAAAAAPSPPTAEDGNASVSSFSADMVSCELLFGIDRETTLRLCL